MTTPAEQLVVRDHPDAVLAAMRGQSRTMVEDLFHGDQYAAVRHAIRTTGYYHAQNGRTLRVSTRPVEGTNDHEVLAIAAVSRDPGRAEDFIGTVQDYQTSGKNRAQLVEMYWKIYRNEGIINNATNKMAAILASKGEFKVRAVRKGKARKAKEELQQLLDWWIYNVNQSAEDGVVTGARGLTAIMQQAVRQGLVEGSWVGRTTWVSTTVGSLGNFDLPMNIQAITTGQLEPLKGLAGTPIEGFYWKPTSALIRELTKPTDKDAAKLLKRYIPNDVVSQLKKSGKALLDPALLMHVKHRGTDFEPFGESLIQCALSDIAFRRAIDQLDLVTMQSLINRLVIVQVGSADPASPYSKADVAAARTLAMQALFEDPGPNMTIVWQGNDVKVEDVGAHSAILDLNDRHRIAEGKVKLDVGVPDALLSGTTTDGKAAGWAAVIGLSAELLELQNAFAQAVRTQGERIALENGFTDIDLAFTFDQSLLVDKGAERDQNRNDYQAGGMSIRTYILGQGRDPDAEFLQRCQERGLEPASTTWEDAFMPPQGQAGQGAAPGQGPGKVPGSGRKPNKQTGKTTPERKVKPTPTENK